MKAYIFPGQGSQFEGMANELTADSHTAQEYLEMADDILKFKISEILAKGSKDDLRKTTITQPAIYLYSVIKSRITREFKPEMVAGHSLGEFSALASVRAFTFAEGLRLVNARAKAMQKACELEPSGMSVVLGLDDAIVDDICNSITQETVVAANFNCPNQIVISGSIKGLDLAAEQLKAAGARMVTRLNVSGAFHSPLMESAVAEFEEAVNSTNFIIPACPVYQNVSGRPTEDVEEIRQNLIKQLTSPVMWSQTIENMVMDGAIQFIDVGPRQILMGMIKRINTRISALSI